MYRHGIIEEIDARTGRARVRFPQHQDLISGWLDVLQRSTQGDQDYWMPRKGNQVACLLDGRLEDGCVLGCVYSETDPPPADRESLRVVEFADGCRVAYDQEAHKLTVAIPAGGTLELCGAASAVALAAKVADELQALLDDYSGHTHQAGPLLLSAAPGAPVTGVTGGPVAVAYAVGDVGSQQVRTS